MTSESNITGAPGGLGSAHVLPGIVQRIREEVVLASTLYWGNLVGQGSPTLKIPRATATPTVTSITPGTTEADAQANTELTSDSVDVTAVPMAVHFTLSDWLIDSSMVNWLEQSKLEAIATLEDYIETAIATLFGSFSTSSGSTGQDLTVASVDAGLVEFGSNSKRKGNGKAIIVLHRQGVGQLRDSLTGGSGAALATPFSNAELISIFGQAGNSVMGTVVGSYYGVPLLQTSNVQKINANVDYCGAIYARSPNMTDVDCALAGVWKWMPEVTQYDKGVNNQLAKSTRGKQACGFAEVQDLLGHRLVHLV